MPAYLVQLAATTKAPILNEVNAMVVFAATSAAAKDIAKTGTSSGSPEKWEGATVTELVAGDPEDFSLYVSITPDGEDEETFEVAAGEESLGDLADAMELLLEASGTIGEEVTVADGPPVTITISADADLGTAVIAAELRRNGEVMAGGVASITAVDEVAATARVITLIAATSLPKVMAELSAG